MKEERKKKREERGEAFAFLILLSLLLICLLVFSACSIFLNEGDAGNVSITIGSSGRAAVPDWLDVPELEDLVHTVLVFDANGVERHRVDNLRYGETKSFSVAPGVYTFQVNALYNVELKAIGNTKRTIHSGANPIVIIQMEAPVTKEFYVSNQNELTTALNLIKEYSVNGIIFNITFKADFDINPQNLSGTDYVNKNITLRGNTVNRRITLSSQGSMFTVGADVELVLKDITLVGRSDNNASLVIVNTDGKLVLNSGGKVTGNTYSTSVNETGGGGVLVDGGTLEIAGGEISGNNVTGTGNDLRGGGVNAVNGSNVLMTGGAIRENTLANVHSGDGNGMGGGIAVSSNTRFEMTGGVIEGNSVNSRSTNLGTGAAGGGVFITGNNSFFYLKGGTIRNNTCHGQSANNYGGSFGGGVSNEGNFIMEGGIINGNSITCSINPNKSYGTNEEYKDGAYGGGVYTWSGSFEKTGGIIYGNDAVGNDADGIPLANTAQSDANGLGGGHAVFYDPGSSVGIAQKPRRNSTSGESHNMNSSVSGSAGGWE